MSPNPPPFPHKTKHYKQMLMKKKMGKTNTHPTIYSKKRGEMAPFRDNSACDFRFPPPPIGFLGEKKSVPKGWPHFLFEFPAPSPATGFLDFFSESNQDLSMKIRFDVK